MIGQNPTFTQTMNSVKSIETKIREKSEACKVLMQAQCSTEALNMVTSLQHEVDKLAQIILNFDFQKAEHE